MAKLYSLGFMKIEAGVTYSDVVDFRLDQVRNKHTEVLIRVRTDNKQSDRIETGDKPTEIKVFAKAMDDKGNPKEEVLVFQGVCTEVELLEQDEYGILTIHARSFSELMDRARISRVFQNPGTLKDIADEIAKAYKNSDIRVNKDIKIEDIEYQNNETDWEFLKRLAGRENLPIYEDRTAKGVALIIGKPSLGFPSDCELEERYIERNIEEYCAIKQNVNEQAESYHFDETVYQTNSVDVMIGQKKGKNVVKECHISSDKSMLRNTVHMINANDECVPFEDSTKDEVIVASIITGVVKEVKGTQVRVEIDNKTDSSNHNEEKKETSGKKKTNEDQVMEGVQKELIWMPYESLMENYFYEMPDEGDRVFCYMEDNTQWICLGSFHGDVKDNDDYKKPKSKVLTNENMMVRFANKTLELIANRSGYEGGSVHSSVVFGKDHGIEIHSTGNISIKSDGDVSFASKANLVVQGKELVNLKVGGSTITITPDRIDIKCPIYKWAGTKKAGECTTYSFGKPKLSNVMTNKVSSGKDKDMSANKVSVKQLARTTLFAMNGKPKKMSQKAIDALASKLYDEQFNDDNTQASETELLNGSSPASSKKKNDQITPASSGSSAKKSKTASKASGNSSTKKKDCGDPINVVTGSMEVSHVDMVVAYTGGEFEVIRNYSSVCQNDNSMLGGKWLSVFGEFIADKETQVDVLIDNLHIESFILVNGQYVSARKGDRSVILDKYEDRYEYVDHTKETRRVFNLEGKLTGKYDKNNNGYELIYVGGVLDKVVFTGNNTLTFEWDGKYLKKITDDIGRSVIYHYEKDLLTQMECIDRTSIYYEYTKDGRIHAITDQNGRNYVKNEYDRLGRVVKQNLSTGEEFVIFYDEKKRETSFTSVATGEVTVYTYDERKLPLKEIYEDGTYKEQRYDAFENIIYDRDREGNETFREYDDCGHMLKETLPNGLCTEYMYDEAGNCVKITDNAGTLITYQYDERGNKVSTTQRIDENIEVTNKYEYDNHGRIISHTNAKGNKETFKYGDKIALAVVYKNYAGESISYEYDKAGRLIKRINAVGTQYYGYDNNNHRIYIENEEGQITRYSYDGLGNLLSVTNPVSNEKKESGADFKIEYDDLDHPVKFMDALGGVHVMRRDSLGNIIEKSGDVPDEVIRYEYDSQNNPIKIIYPDGGVETRSYDLNSNMTKKITPEYQKTQQGNVFIYDAMNCVVKVDDGNGSTTYEAEYDLKGNQVRIYSSENGEVRQKFDLRGNVTERRTLLNTSDDGVEKWSLVKFAYDVNGNQIREDRFLAEQSIESATGEILRLESSYDEQNRLVSFSDGLGAKITYTYDAVGRMVSMCQYDHDEKTMERFYEYNASGKVVRLIETDNENTKSHKTVYTYDANGNITKVKSPLGHVIKRNYDRLDRIIEETHEGADGIIKNTKLYKYDTYGNLLSQEITSDGITTKTLYDMDVNGRVNKVTYPDGSKRCVIYDKNGRMAGVQTAMMYATGDVSKAYHYDYTVNGQISRITDPFGELVREYQYTLDGKVSQVLDAVSSGVNYIYDKAGRVVSVESTGGSTQKMSYNPWGQMTSVIDGNGTKTRFELDAWGRVTTVCNADNSKESYEYNVAGQMVKSTDGNGNSVEYAFNSFGQMSSRTDALGNSEYYEYDTEGNLSTYIDRNGVKTTFAYNMYHDMVRRNAGTLTETFGYDGLGRLSHCIGSGMRYDYSYDVMNRLVRKSASGRTLLEYGYDHDGKMTHMSDITGKNTQYAYDLLGRLKTVSDDGHEVASYSYDKAGRQVGASLGGLVRQTRSYNPDGLIASLKTEYLPQNRTLLDDTYSYDGNANLISKKTLTGESVFAYDALNRLVSVNVKDECFSEGNYIESFGYDHAGNRLSRNKLSEGMEIIEKYRYDAGNRLQQIERITNELNQLESMVADDTIMFSYDKQGNMLSDTQFEYEYDAFNRLVSAKGVSEANAGKSLVNRYDAEGLRYEMEENEKLVGFIFSGDDVVTETKDDEVVRYIRGLDIIASDCERARTYYHLKDCSDSYSYYCTDNQGSVSHIVDNTGLLNQYEYDVFGNTLSSRETIPNRFRYTGQQYDAVTNQYYLRARFYNPVIARFLQEDTYLGDGLNLFAYCQNNPLKYYDPSGHMCVAKETSFNILKVHLGADANIESEYKKYRAESKNAEEVRKKLEAKYGKLTPAQKAKLKGFDGIGTTDNGGPDFSGTDYIYSEGGKEFTVKIKMTGDRGLDFQQANKKMSMGNSKSSPVPGYTWHHVDDYNPRTGECTMQLVRTDAHQATYSHKGACAQYDQYMREKIYNK